MHGLQNGQEQEIEEARIVNTVQVTTEPAANESAVVHDNSKRLKKFTFTKETKHTLMKCVVELDAHLAAHGDKDKIYSEVRNLFVTQLSPDVWSRVQKPSVKTLRDKVRAMLLERKKKNLANESASGIAEELTPCDVLLDDILHQISESNEERRKKRIELNAAEQALSAAGGAIRLQALIRTGGSLDETPKKKKHKRSNEDEFNCWFSTVDI